MSILWPYVWLRAFQFFFKMMMRVHCCQFLGQNAGSRINLASLGTLETPVEGGPVGARTMTYKLSTPCGTRTRNLRIKSPTPCPLGQGGNRYLCRANHFAVAPAQRPAQTVLA